MNMMYEPNQKELRDVACNAAYTLVTSLEKIQDEDFVDSVLCAVSNNDKIMLVELMYEL